MKKCCIESKKQEAEYWTQEVLDSFREGKKQAYKEVFDELDKIQENIEEKLKQIDKENKRCKNCGDLTYCKLHMLMYRRIEDITNKINELKKKFMGETNG